MVSSQLLYITLMALTSRGRRRVIWLSSVESEYSQEVARAAGENERRRIVAGHDCQSQEIWYYPNSEFNYSVTESLLSSPSSMYLKGGIPLPKVHRVYRPFTFRK